MRKLIPYTFAVILLLCGCSSKLSGTIQSDTLGDRKPHDYAPVEIVSEAALKKHLSQKFSEDRSIEIQKLKDSLVLSEKHLEKLMAAKVKLQSAVIAATFATGTYGFSAQEFQRLQSDKSRLSAGINSSTNTLNSTDDHIEKINHEINLIKLKMKNLISGRDGRHFYSDPIDGAVKTKTDANGRFTISYAKSENQYLVARGIGKYWCIKINAENDAIFLTDQDTTDVSESIDSCPNIKSLHPNHNLPANQ